MGVERVCRWVSHKKSPPKFLSSFDTGGEVLYNQNAFEKAYRLQFSSVFQYLDDTIITKRKEQCNCSRRKTARASKSAIDVS